MTPKNDRIARPICVIGAGPSGLCALKTLKEAGLNPIAFEIGSKVGGLWEADNDNGRGGAYQSLHINTSTRESQFSDFPLEANAGDFPNHRKMAAYFRSYASHFGLFESIRFHKEVMKCAPVADGYEVTTFDRQTESTMTERFSAVVVANGHHWSPAYPPLESFESFRGTVLHSADYKSPSNPHDFASDRVLVVGMGNSAVDIACELSKQGSSRSVTVAARRGAWVLPKYILGRPLDQGRVIPSWLPGRLRRRVVTASFRMLFGKMSDYGLPEPDHLIGEAHPTVSSEFPGRVKQGIIHVRPGFESARDHTVTFADGSSEQYDSIVFCTGYDVRFPFFSPNHISAENNRLPLYHRAFHLEHRRVFFVGLAQTVGAIMPVAEAQARAIAAHIAGHYNLPTNHEMKNVVRQDEATMAACYVSSRRHSMQVVPDVFLRRLNEDMKRGARRAKRGEGVSFSALEGASS